MKLGIGIVLGGLLAAPAALATPNAYITEGSFGRITVIDTATSTVVAASIPLPESQNIAVSPVGSRLYVTAGGRTVRTFDTTTNTLIGSAVVMNGGGNGVAVNPTGTRVYVTQGDRLVVIDPVTYTIVASIFGEQGQEGVAVSPDGTRVYVANRVSNTVWVIDTAMNTVVGSPIPVGDQPRGVAVSPSGTRVYVGNWGSASVSVIDTATNTVVGSPIPVGSGPMGVVVNWAGTRVYVANSDSNSVSVIDTATHTVVGSPIPVGSSPQGVDVTPAGTRVYVVNQSSNNVSIIDTTTSTVVTTIPVGSAPASFGRFIGPDTTPTARPGGPYAVACQPGSTAVVLDGSASSSPGGNATLAYSWTTDCPGATLAGATTPTPTLNIPATGACSTACTVTLTVSDGALSATRSAPVTVTPDTTLAQLQAVNSSTRVTVAPTMSGQTIVTFANTGSCPIQVTGVSVAGDFSNPALSIAASAPSLPFIVCPGASVGIPVNLASSAALAGTYQAVVQLTGSAGSASAGIEISVSAGSKPDIALASPGILGDLGGPPPLLDATQGFTVTAPLSNLGNSSAGPFTIEVLAVVDHENVLLGSSAVAGLASGATTSVQVHVPGGLLPAGFHVIRAQLAQAPPEGDLSAANNSAARFLQLGNLPIGGAVIVVAAGADQGCVGSVINVSGRADYYLASSIGALVDFPVQGGKVTVTVLDGTSQVVSVTSSVHTLTTGSYLQPVPAPPPGSYTVLVSVTDFSVDGEVETDLTVLNAFQCQVPVPAPPPPIPSPAIIDLWVCHDDIRYFAATPSGDCTTTPLGAAVAGVPVCVRADVSYYATGTAPPLSMQPVAARAHVHNPATGEFDTVAVHQESLSFTGAGSLPIEFVWTPPNAGEHVIEIAWEPTIVQHLANDRATRGIVVGSGLPGTPLVVALEVHTSCAGAIDIRGDARYESDSGERLAVGCGLVTARVYDTGDVEVSSSGGVSRTAADGSFGTTLFASLPPGAYTLRVTVTDGVLTGTAEHGFTCEVVVPDVTAPAPPPEGFYGDVYIHAEDIVFLGDASCSTGLLRNPEPGEPVGLHATTHYTHSGPEQAHSVTMTAVEHVPLGDELVAVVVDSSGPLALPPAGGSVSVCLSWIPQSAGTRIMQVVLEPDFSQFELNDAATRVITAGSLVCNLATDVRTVDLVAGQPGALTVSARHSGGSTPTLTLSLKPLPPATALPAGLTATFTPAGGLTTPFSATLTLSTTTSLAPGRYPLAVLGRGDLCNALGAFTLVVRSPNQQPVADAGPDQAVDENEAVTLDGSASHDGENDPLTYTWRQVAGPVVVLNLADPIRPTFVAPLVPTGGRTLTFELIVYDGHRASEAAIVNVTVKDVNHPPVADAGDDQTVQEGSFVALDGANSFDADGDALTYSWLQTIGTAAALSGGATDAPTFTAPLVGPAGESLTLRLTVGDGLASAVDTVLVHVSNVNQAPLARAGADQTVDEASVVTLDASGSTDPDGDTLTRSWLQASGPPVTLSDSQAVSPTFTAPEVDEGGAHLVFSLVVHDGLVSSAADAVAVHVQNVNDPPVCSLARPSVASLWPPNHKLVLVAIEGVSDPENNQVVVTILGVTQDEPLNGLGDGDTSPDAVIQGSAVLLRAERSGLGNGRVYRIRFQADDGNGGTCIGTTVGVSVPHDRKDTAIDSGQAYNSLQQ